MYGETADGTRSHKKIQINVQCEVHFITLVRYLIFRHNMLYALSAPSTVNKKYRNISCCFLSSLAWYKKFPMFSGVLFL